MTNIRTTRTKKATEGAARAPQRRLRFGAFCLGLGALAACDTAENPIEALVKGTPPDEFAVITRAPLIIPKTQSLPEPTPGERSRLESDPQGDAIRALTGGTARDLSTAQTSAAERVLLGAADAAAADPSIRSQLEQDEEKSDTAEDGTYVPPSLSELFLEPGEKPVDRATVLDPDREARRLQTGGVVTPVNPGEAPPESGAGEDSPTE